MQEAGILHDWLAVSSSSACLLAASANPQLEIIGRQCWGVGVGRVMITPNLTFSQKDIIASLLVWS